MCFLESQFLWKRDLIGNGSFRFVPVLPSKKLAVEAMRQEYHARKQVALHSVQEGR